MIHAPPPLYPKSGFCRIREVGADSLYSENRHPIIRYAMMGINIHPRRPGLVRVAHRLARTPVAPFVELPFFLDPQAVDLGQFLQLAAGLIHTPSFDQRGDIEPAHERPDAAVVILLWQVQVVVAIVLAPVFIAWM